MAVRNLKIGLKDVTDIRYGELPVDRVCVGDTIVWERGSSVFSFGGIAITPGPLYWSGGIFNIAPAWNDPSWVSLANTSYGSIYGRNEGSVYFALSDMASIFDSKGEGWEDTFKNQSGYGSFDIDNSGTVSYGDYDWRMITKTEARLLTGTAYDDNWNPITRSGSTVNGTAGCYWADVRVTSDTAFINNRKGVLLFPDDVVMTGADVSCNSSTGGPGTTLTEAQVDAYVQQGCVFLPCWGQRYMDTSGDLWNDCKWSTNPIAYGNAVFSTKIDLNGGYLSGVPYGYGIALGPSLNRGTIYTDDLYLGMGGNPHCYLFHYMPQWLVRTI